MSRHSKRHRYQTVIALDACYLPMVEMSRRRALRAVATGRAHVIDLKTWSKLGLQDAVGRPFHAVVFPHAKATSETKLGIGRGGAAILKRDGYRCLYCGRKATTVDHIQPRCQGGLSVWSNLCAACVACNSRKGGRTPEQAGMTLLWPIRSRRALLLERLHELAGTG